MLAAIKYRKSQECAGGLQSPSPLGISPSTVLSQYPIGDGFNLLERLGYGKVASHGLCKQVLRLYVGFKGAWGVRLEDFCIGHRVQDGLPVCRRFCRFEYGFGGALSGGNGMPRLAPHLGQKVGFEQRLHEPPSLFWVLACSRNH